jgi:dephospho-CoA kinase
MKKIGVTGGIGSGKSHICRIIQDMNYPVFYTDNESKKILCENKIVKCFITRNYGEESFIDGKPNSKHLANILFNDDSEMKKLHQIVSPILRKNLNDWILKQENDGYDFCFVESAIMFEYNLNKIFDSVICVSTGHETRIQRVLKRDAHRTREDVINIISKQFSETKRIELSDYVIFNDGIEERHTKSKDVLESEISSILKEIIE